VRQSASVEIQRDHSQELQDLQTWREKLCGAELDDQVRSPGTKDDRNSDLKKLDSLYARIGSVGAGMPLPPSFEKSKQPTLDFQKELQAAKSKVRDLTQRLQSTTDRRKAATIKAELSQARLAEQQAAQRWDFACVVLGRECVNEGFVLPGLEREYAEIRSLQNRFT
jgi:hypothetical protein